jgi:hypothetical protein
MPKTPYSSTRPSAPASARAEDTDMEDEGMEGDERPNADLLIAALLGAAVGAGVGLLASRAFADDSSTMDRAVRQIRRRTRTVRRAVPDVGEMAASVSGTVSDARRAAERTFKEEMRAMRRALRRRRRELGL